MYIMFATKKGNELVETFATREECEKRYTKLDAEGWITFISKD